MDKAMIKILFSCNEWKEYSSMEIIAVSTDMRDIYEVIKTQIRNGNMVYETATKRAGVRIFNDALRRNCVNFDLLDFGYLDEYENLAASKSRRKNANDRRMKYV